MNFLLRLKIAMILLATVLLSSSCSNDLCSNTELSRVKSPSGEYDAVLFSRNCGATTKEGFHLSIIESGDPLNNSEGNVYTTYDRINMSWDGDSKVIIDGPSEGDDVFKAKAKYKKINIIYQE